MVLSFKMYGFPNIEISLLLTIVKFLLFELTPNSIILRFYTQSLVPLYLPRLNSSRSFPNEQENIHCQLLNYVQYMVRV